MDELNDNKDLVTHEFGYQSVTKDNQGNTIPDSGSFSHIGYIRGGYRTVPSASDIPLIHHSRLDEGQIIYALSESKTYIISKTAPTFFAESSASYAEFYFPSLGSGGGVGVGFPYSGSDDQFGLPAQAIITGSLLLSGSGFLTASAINVANIQNTGEIVTTNLSASSQIIALTLQSAGNTTVGANLSVLGDTDLSSDLNVFGQLQVDSNISTNNNLNVANNLDVGGTLSFDGFTFSDGNISVLSGSNIFGTSSLNTHEFTGSVLISGALSVEGDTNISGSSQITGSLDILGDLLINGIPLDFSGIADEEILIGGIMINTGIFQKSSSVALGGEYLVGSHDDNNLKGNLNNQIAFTSSLFPEGEAFGQLFVKNQLEPGDKVRIDWTYEGVAYSHTTHIFDIKTTSGSDFNRLTAYEGTGGNIHNQSAFANPPYVVDYTSFEYGSHCSMSLQTGITASHWRELVEEITTNRMSSLNPSSPSTVAEWDKGLIGWGTWFGTANQTVYDGSFHSLLNTTFTLTKIIPGIPCCDPFGDSFYNASHLPDGNITIHGGITTIDGPIRADGELIADQGLIVKVPDNPNFFDPTKYDKGTDKPMATVKSGSVDPIRINDQGIFQLHKFTDFEPTPQVGGILFRNNEMYLGKE